MNALGQVIVLGADGQLGRQMAADLRTMAEWDVQAWDQPQIDITDYARLRRLIRDIRPKWVVNCAAMTHVDGCETHPEKAIAVNADAVVHMADACNDVGAALLQISTDFVFDGILRRPYREDDPRNPLGVYAQSKYQGEEWARGCDQHLIVRTAWLYGAGGNNFVNTILTRARAGQALRVVVDEIGSPSYAADVADGLLRLMHIDARGTYHLVNAGEASWYELACRVVELAGIDADITAATAAEYASPTPRPKYSVLDCTKYTEAAGHRPRPWAAALEEFVQEAV